MTDFLVQKMVKARKQYMFWANIMWIDINYLPQCSSYSYIGRFEAKVAVTVEGLRLGACFQWIFLDFVRKSGKKMLIGFRIITCTSFVTTKCSIHVMWSKPFIHQITSWFTSIYSRHPSPIFAIGISNTQRSWKPFYTVLSDNIYKNLRCLVSKFKEYLYSMAFTQEKEHNSFINVLQQYLDN